MTLKVLSVACTILTVFICICSLWCMEAHHKGYMADAFGTFYGSIGLVITVVFALAGIVLSISWMRRNNAVQASFKMRWWLIPLTVNSLVVLITLPWLLFRGDLS